MFLLSVDSGLAVIFFMDFEEIILLSSDFISLCSALQSQNLPHQILLPSNRHFPPPALLVVVGKGIVLIQVVYHSQKSAVKINL